MTLLLRHKVSPTATKLAATPHPFAHLARCDVGLGAKVSQVGPGWQHGGQVEGCDGRVRVDRQRQHLQEVLRKCGPHVWEV